MEEVGREDQWLEGRARGQEESDAAGAEAEPVGFQHLVDQDQDFGFLSQEHPEVILKQVLGRG